MNNFRMSTFKECLEKFDIVIASDMMLHGKTQKEIGEYFGGISSQRVSELFKHFNVKFVRRKSFIDDKFFDEINTEEKAYILGYLVADGCIRHEVRKSGNISYRIAFNNSIDDKETIELIHSLICPNTALKIVNSSTKKVKRKDSYVLQWGSEYMCKKLENKYNIKPKKTFDSNFYIPEGCISEYLWRHFIRGYFDGDGHVSPSSIEFVFTSEPFMHQVLRFFKNFKYRCYKIDGKTVTYYKVVITGGKNIISYTKDFFYKDSKYYLNRKYKQFNPELTDSITQGGSVV